MYDGGVLSNRLTEDTTVRVTKRWDAAAYQADFADVSVTFTLQQRVKSTASDASDDGGGETDAPARSRSGRIQSGTASPSPSP